MSDVKEWSNEEIKQKLLSSDAWMARAMYALGENFDELTKKHGLQSKNSDRTFFLNFATYFKENGHFTPRQVKLARQKVRDQYLDILRQLANEYEVSRPSIPF